MRGATSIAIPVALVVALSLMSRSTSPTFSGRTSRRVVTRLIEESQQALESRDRNPAKQLANVVTARTWAQAAIALVGEDGTKAVTGVDARHLVDKAQSRVKKIVQQLNIPQRQRRRTAVDAVLAVAPIR